MHVCTELKKSLGSPRPPPSGDSAGGGTTQKWENEIHSLSVWENVGKRRNKKHFSVFENKGNSKQLQ